MIISYSLIKELVDLPADLSIDDIAKKLTFSGLEVEGIDRVASGTNLTVGEIISLEPHPDSDHLNLLKVDCGHHGIFDIVCGAPNARVGLKVIVALVGAKLEKIGLTIKESTIAGYKSSGMCCSLLELGVDEDTLSDEQKAGIEELPLDFKVGADNVLELLGLDDIRVDINVLPNRPDLLSHIGVAKELSALYGAPLKYQKPIGIKKTNAIKVGSSTSSCNLFALLEVKTDGKITRSPRKLVTLLNTLGYRSINLAVDLGNLLMAVTGQPFHFYDLDKVKAIDNSLAFEVRDDFEGEVITLDSKNLDVASGDLVVTNGKTPMCLAGVMGLKNVETTIESTHFGIEAASFNYQKVRSTVNRTGLSSDSSSRFAKRVNPLLAEESLFLLSAVYQSLDPSFEVISYSLYDETDKQEVKIPFSLSRLNNRLGSNFSEQEVMDVLNRLGLKKEGDYLIPPISRPDLKEQADIEEEVFRFNPSSLLDMRIDELPETRGGLTREQSLIRKIKNDLTSKGAYEILSYTLIDEEADKSYRIFNRDIKSIKIANAMTKDHEYVRSDLISSLVKTIQYNRDRKHDDFILFEVSNIDREDGLDTFLAIGLTGINKNQGLLQTRSYDFYDLKNIIYGVLEIAGLDNKRISLKAEGTEFLHPGRSASIYVGKTLIAVFGEISPRYIKERTLVGEINLGELFKIKSSQLKFQPLTIYPEVERDFAFVLKSEIMSQELVSLATRTLGASLKSADIFDVFVLNDLEKSLAIKLRFQSFDHTFKEEELKSLSDKFIEAVQIKLGGRLR